MNNLFLSAYGAILLTIGSAWAIPPSDCIWDRTDTFDTGARIPGPSITGKTGQCLDTREERSIVILNLDPKNPNEEPAEGFRVANFRYQNRFWIAQFPPSQESISQIIFEKQHFPVPRPLNLMTKAAHAMLRFKLKEGRMILLRSQDKSSRTIESTEPREAHVSDFMYSVEAIGTEGFQFDPLKALEGDFALAYRLVATEEKFRKVVQEAHQKTEQFRLNINEADKAPLFKTAILLSHASALKSMYRLSYRNCATEIFRVLDSSLNYKEYNGRRTLPHTNFPPKADIPLRKRGLIDASSKLQDLNDEKQ